MKKFYTVLILLIFPLQAVNSRGGLTTDNSVIPANRLATVSWQNAGLTSIGGIPTRSTRCGSVLIPIGGGTSDITQIQNAINACTVGQYVELGSGTFTFVGTAGTNYVLINKGITLRGQGAGVTTINKSNGATAATLGVAGDVGPHPDPLVILGPTNFTTGTDPANPTGYNLSGISGATNLASDAVQGASSVTVTSTSGLSVGQYVIVDQYTPAGWQPDNMGGNSNVSIPQTVTISIASPTIITWPNAPLTNNGLNVGTAIKFTTTGALPTGITANTNYYVTNDASFTATGFHISDTQAHALAGTNRINATGSQSGTQTGTVIGYQIWATPDYSIQYQKHNPSFSFVDDFDNFTYPTTPQSTGEQYSRLNRVQNEVKKIASIVGTTVTFTSPFTQNYLAANTAQVAAFTETFVEQAGVEKITFIGGDSNAIQFKWCGYCWADHIENTVWVGQGINFFECFRCQLSHSYSHVAANASPGGGAYAIALDFGSAECLIVDNISILANKVIVARAAGSGSVVSYNYFDMGYINYSENWIEMGLNASHFVGPQRILFEGNYGVNTDSDDTHGASTYITFFRNWVRGIRSTFVNPYTGNTVNDASGAGSPGPARGSGPTSYGYWFSMAGNVYGASGAMSGWVYNGTNWGCCQQIWLMGWNSDYNNSPNFDPMVPSTIWRSGNWDWVTSSQKWENGSAQTIPNSLYLSSKPSFFGSNPWPWVDPSTGATGPFTSSAYLPALARYLAGTPNL